MREASRTSTLSTIRHILEENDISVKIVDDGSHDGIYSVHLHIDCGLLQMELVTNGKGSNKDQALVSAYGELMERIQSFVIFPNREAFSAPFKQPDNHHYHKTLPFHYAPDEKVMSGKDQPDILLPFFDVAKQNVAYLDYRKIEYKSGSNGIASGSSITEALLYSIYEIFERYALRLIYDKSLTPPIIENRTVSKESYADCTIEILDCSCGIGLPVLGVLLRNTINGDYRFSLCADINTAEAVESAICEIFQAGQSLKFVHYDIRLMDRMADDAKLMEKERLKYHNGTNQLPKSFWADTPSYEPYIALQDNALDNSSCLKKCIDLISSLGHDLYVRDVSFLSFPTVISFISGMSELFDCNDNYWTQKTFGKMYDMSLRSHRLPALSPCELDEFITFQSQFSEPAFTSLFNSGDVWHTGDTRFVLGVIALSTERFDQALRWFDKLLKTTGANVPLTNIYNCFRDYANRKSDEQLREKYNPNLVDMVIACHKNQQWKSLFNLTDCFNCTDCRFKSTCAADNYYTLLNNLMSKYASNCPNQLHWKEILPRLTQFIP